MTPDRPDDMLFNLFDGFRGFRELLSEELAKHDLSITHFVAMRILEKRDACTMSKLTACLDVTHGASTGIIDRLARLGLVDRDHSPQDRRVVHVSLNHAGQALLSELIIQANHRLEAVINRLDEPSRLEVARGLSILADAFRASHASSDGESTHAASR